MALKQMNIDWSNIKTYATEANLMKAIEQHSSSWTEHNDRFVVVMTPTGRWTAIVQLDMSKGGFVGRYPFLKI